MRRKSNRGGLAQRVSDLCAARLETTSMDPSPDADAVRWGVPDLEADSAAPSRFDRAAALAIDFHTVAEMPANQPRPPRAVLAAMATVALRNAM